MIPTDQWVWDAEAGEVVALDVTDTRGGDTIPVDFTDEPPGQLAAAAPDMARALVTTLDAHAPDWRTAPASSSCAVCKPAMDALRKAGVL